MRLEGSLDAFSLPDILALLAMTRKTGSLHLQRPAAHGVVHLAEGRVTGASANVDRQVLARRLAEHVTEDALTQAVATAQRDPAGSVVRALVQSGAVGSDVAGSVVAEQVADAVFELLRWDSGDFGFDLDTTNPDDVGVSLAVEDVVAEARRRLDSWPAVTEVVPSPDTVLAVALAPASEPVLTHEEWALLALVDGRRSVTELVGLAGRGEFAVVSALAALVSRGLLVGADDAGVAAVMRRLSLIQALEPTAPAATAAAAPAATSTTVTVPAPPAFRPGPPAVHEPAPAPAPAPAPRVPAPSSAHHVVGSSAVAPAPVPAPTPVTSPDRDPAINRSLLLRLIAGVQGL